MTRCHRHALGVCAHCTHSLYVHGMHPHAPQEKFTVQFRKLSHDYSPPHISLLVSLCSSHVQWVSAAVDVIEMVHAANTGTLTELSEAEAQDCCGVQRPGEKSALSCLIGLGGLCSIVDYPTPKGSCGKDECRPVFSMAGWTAEHVRPEVTAVRSSSPHTRPLQLCHAKPNLHWLQHKDAVRGAFSLAYRWSVHSYGGRREMMKMSPPCIHAKF